MTPLIVGVLLGFALALPGLVYLARELRLAQERLLGAWKEGAIIPPRPEAQPTPVALEPLPAGLQVFVESWESKESQMREEARIRRWLADGWKPERIVKHLSDPEPGT